MGMVFVSQMGFPSLRKCLFLEVTSRSRAAEPHPGCLSPLNVRVISHDGQDFLVRHTLVFAGPQPIRRGRIERAPKKFTVWRTAHR